ncbi:hypothetical protein LX32DRAFT_637204 [Colletotrichum zoysiae]|uniref:Uncharacterized protein n=1 Tax=Colletotrichum zoysiae TaxID=1216348 RepID=A0AAD9M735_9PEZI|nr:hypothetical protein LX32DRAFT_637204 [Colletotrichum zoysiae]
MATISSTSNRLNRTVQSARAAAAAYAILYYCLLDRKSSSRPRRLTGRGRAGPSSPIPSAFGQQM